ncbi:MULTISPECIES: ABC transporter permease [Thermoactinomyces]|jgi:putative ABC transport system permease protein|uniref:ABC transporter permease n=1 Tax=Thermoactinomyces daqus TaxID=1329516 RepID=A0A7W1X956_9BACL|nr:MULTISPECIES: ABC transporter permease [Thermoactinomyces]MBA4542402.1 ABC transporter permease [Thermoactinomyces daqus]MBH8607380.1 ABC transporter permease [Thermoactinomyces sp. CICC 10521]
MKLAEHFRMALDSILAHKLRSVLTMLGIIIGVASVMIIVSIGQGGTDQLTEQFAGSKNTINLVPKRDQSYLDLPGDEQIFTQGDIEELKRIPEVRQVLSYSYDTATIRYRDHKVDGAIVFGINRNSHLISNGAKVDKGRLFYESDFNSSSGGVILSDVVARKLFPSQSALGQIVRIKGQPLKVIGVLDKAEGIQGLLQTPEVYLPAQTWRVVFGKLKIDQVTLQVSQADQMERAGKEAVNILNRNHNKTDGYEVQNLEQLTQGITQIARIMTIVIGSIGGISLLVGGIGVMNIMLVSVTERTREIGIRKALGASRNNILMQFLVESITLSLIGGAIGILLGAAVAGGMEAIGLWPASVSLPVAIGGLLFSMVFGIVFGILPANKAARLHPIECLRYE